MWAGSLSHNDLTNCGSDRGDWASHQMEHELGGMYDVAHGAGLAALWGTWARYVYKDSLDRFVKYAVKVHGIEPKETDEATALAGIEATEAFYRKIGMPTSLTELGITVSDEDIDVLAEKCTAFGKRTIGCVKALGKEDIMAIYKAAI